MYDPQNVLIHYLIIVVTENFLVCIGELKEAAIRQIKGPFCIINWPCQFDWAIEKDVELLALVIIHGLCKQIWKEISCMKIF